MTTTDGQAQPPSSPRAKRRHRRWRVLSMTFLLYAMIVGVPPLHTAVLLMIYPWLLLSILFFRPEVDDEPEKNPLDMHIVMGTVALATRAYLLVHLMDAKQVILPALLPGGFMFAMTALVMRLNGRSMAGAMIAAAFAGLFYGYGATLFTNAIFDRSPPEVFQTRVLEKHLQFGNGSSGPEMKLAPWGPQTEEKWETHLPLLIYQHIDVGTRICIYYHPGLANIAWYDIRGCRKERKECRKEPDCRAWLDVMRARIIQDAGDAPKQGKTIPPVEK